MYLSEYMHEPRHNKISVVVAHAQAHQQNVRALSQLSTSKRHFPWAASRWSVAAQAPQQSVKALSTITTRLAQLQAHQIVSIRSKSTATSTAARSVTALLYHRTFIPVVSPHRTSQHIGQHKKQSEPRLYQWRLFPCVYMYVSCSATCNTIMSYWCRCHAAHKCHASLCAKLGVFDAKF